MIPIPDLVALAEARNAKMVLASRHIGRGSHITCVATHDSRRRAAQVEKGTLLAYQTAARPCHRACPSPGRRVQVLGVTEECLRNCMGASL